MKNVHIISKVVQETTKVTPSVPTPNTSVTPSDANQKPSPAIGSQSERKGVRTKISKKTKHSCATRNAGSNQVAKKRPFMMGGMTRRQASCFERFFYNLFGYK